MGLVFIYKDCLGWFCLIFVYTTMILANSSYYTTVFILKQQQKDFNTTINTFFLVVYELLMFMTLLSHFRVMTSEPGYVAKNVENYVNERLPGRYKKLVEFQKL